MYRRFYQFLSFPFACVFFVLVDAGAASYAHMHCGQTISVNPTHHLGGLNQSILRSYDVAVSDCTKRHFNIREKDSFETAEDPDFHGFGSTVYKSVWGSAPVRGLPRGYEIAPVNMFSRKIFILNSSLRI